MKILWNRNVRSVQHSTAWSTTDGSRTDGRLSMAGGEPAELPTGTSRDPRTKEPLSRLDPGNSQGATEVLIPSTPATEDVAQHPSTLEEPVDPDDAEDADLGQTTEDVDNEEQPRQGTEDQDPTR